jgi:hypothetical protein
MQYSVRPSGWFVGMTRTTRIRDFVFVGHAGSNELESVGVDLYLCNGGLYRGHMTRNALASWTALFVMRVRFNRRRSGTVRR